MCHVFGTSTSPRIQREKRVTEKERTKERHERTGSDFLT